MICIFRSLALIQSLSAPLAVNILNYLCLFFFDKAGLFTKFVDTFFLFVGKKSFLAYDRIKTGDSLKKTKNMRHKRSNETLFQILLYFQEKKGVSMET